MGNVWRWGVVGDGGWLRLCSHLCTSIPLPHSTALPPLRVGSSAQDWLTSKQWAWSELIPTAAQECGAGTNTNWFQGPPGWDGHHPSLPQPCAILCVWTDTQTRSKWDGRVLPGTAAIPNIYSQPLQSPPPAWLPPPDFGFSELPIRAALTMGTRKAALLWSATPGMGLSLCHPVWGQRTSLAVCPAARLSRLGCTSSANEAAEIYSSSHKAMASSHRVWGCAGTCSQCPPPIPSPRVALSWGHSLDMGT